jgi:hypothetical protein
MTSNPVAARRAKNGVIRRGYSGVASRDRQSPYLNHARLIKGEKLTEEQRQLVRGSPFKTVRGGLRWQQLLRGCPRPLRRNIASVLRLQGHQVARSIATRQQYSLLHAFRD